MKEFFQDNHYPDGATLNTSDVADIDFINEVRRHYPVLPLEWELIGNVNINSLNFKAGPYYVKAVSNPKGAKNHVLKFPKIREILLKFKVPTTEFIESVNGRLIESVHLNQNECLVYVQPFVEADFFTGQANEFEEMRQMISRLKEAAPFLQKEMGADRSIEYSSIGNFQKWSPQQQKSDLSEFEKFLVNNWKLLETTYESLLKVNFMEGISTFHCDLHPHNVLTRHQKIIAIIDLESFVPMPESVFEGFSLFKLGRKWISKSPSSLQSLQDQVRGLNLLLPTQAELMRRISIVLKLHYEEQDNRFDQDLYKHITGLKESQLIFKS